jgi:hypothetical protein
MKPNPKWTRIKAAALSLLGLSAFVMKDNKLDVSEEQRTRLAQSFGDKFPEALEKHLSKAEAGDGSDDPEMSDQDFKNLMAHLMTDAFKALKLEKETVDARLAEANRLIASQKEVIQTLSDAPEEDVIPSPKPDANTLNPVKFKPDMTLVHNRMWKAQNEGMMVPSAEDTMVIDSIKTEFGKYVAGQKKNIIRKLTAKTETMQYMTTVQTADSIWKAAYASMSHVVQQFAAAWTPLGKATFTPIAIHQRGHKINVPLTPAEVIDTWLGHLYDEGKSPEQMPLVPFIIDMIIEKAFEDREMLQVMTGEYEEITERPADGTPGQVTEKSVDGLLTILRKQYEDPDTKVHFVALGEITEANVVDKMKQFRKSLPRELVRKPMDMLLSDDLRGMYKDAYQTLYPNTKNEDANNERLDHSQIRLAPVASLSGLKSFLVTPKDNLILLRDKNDVASKFRLDTLHYTVFIYSEWREAYGIAVQEATVAYIDPIWVVDYYAKKNDASKLLIRMLTDAGCDDVNAAKLAGYKTAIAAATGVADLAALQTIVDTVNAA